MKGASPRSTRSLEQSDISGRAHSSDTQHGRTNDRVPLAHSGKKNHLGVLKSLSLRAMI